MTNTELKAQINTQITTETVDNSITPLEVGGNMEDIIDLTKPYRELRFKLSISGTTPTPTYLVNDFSGETITMTIPSAGKLRISITNNPLTSGSTQVVTGIVNNAGTPFFLLPDYGLLPVLLDIDIRRWDNDQTTTPALSAQWVEIRVYD